MDKLIEQAIKNCKINKYEKYFGQVCKEYKRLLDAENQQLNLQNVRLSLHNCDAEITKHVDTLDTPEGQDQYTHDTAFIKGAIWMRERIADYLGEQ